MHVNGFRILFIDLPCSHFTESGIFKETFRMFMWKNDTKYPPTAKAAGDIKYDWKEQDSHI